VPHPQFNLFLQKCEWDFNTANSKQQLTQINHGVKQALVKLSRTAPFFLFFDFIVAIEYFSEETTNNCWLSSAVTFSRLAG
jgi:hypothetical protein